MKTRKPVIYILILTGIFFFGQHVSAQHVRCAEMLGRPENTGITISIVFDTTMQVRAIYGTSSGVYSGHTSWQTVNQDSMNEAAAEIKITGLNPSTEYYYRLRYRAPGDTAAINRQEYKFSTAKMPGDTFTFIVEADPHLDANSDTALYRQCLSNQHDDNADFMIDMGDFLMSEKLKNAANLVPEDTVPYRCKYLRSFYQTLCTGVPLFNVIGNHEGEQGWYLNGTSASIPVWSTNFRKKYYMNPYPDAFYSGDSAHYQYVGQRESYYSWEWGDALFIVLDPYWFTTTKPDTLHGWRWTLGKTQYDWLRSTLENSAASFKFVFCHQLVGGNEEGRGGIEWANLYEWGGLNPDSTDGWAANRPGWYKPIRKLLEENRVTIFFHGHDHFFDKQQLDCLVYQECPQPSLPNFNNPQQAVTYGYLSGQIIPNSGHLRISVSPSAVNVKYIRACLPSQETASLHNKDIACSYTIQSVNCYDSTSNNIQNNIKDYDQSIEVFPNPFSGIISIRISTKGNLDIYSLGIFDLNGKSIRQLIAKPISQGSSITFRWDGTDEWGNAVDDGIYFCRAVTGKSCSNVKIVLCR